MSLIDDFIERIEQREVILLDGATGTELERRGVPMNQAAWSAAAVITHPDVIRNVHEDYIRAGSEIIITNSFSTARHQLVPAGLGDEFRSINRHSAELALEARDSAADRPVLVAGSISSIHFDIDKKCPVKEAESNFLEQADILAEAGVDLLMMEMMWDVEYSRAALQAAVRIGLPTWVGFSCRLGADDTVMMFSKNHDGTFSDVLEALLPLGGSVMNIMHTETEHVAPALKLLMERWSGPVGAYGHSGEFVMPHWQFNDVISPQLYFSHARKWVEVGAQLIGGCCGIGPEHIRMLSEGLPRQLG